MIMCMHYYELVQQQTNGKLLKIIEAKVGHKYSGSLVKGIVTNIHNEVI